MKFNIDEYNARQRYHICVTLVSFYRIPYSRRFDIIWCIRPSPI